MLKADLHPKKKPNDRHWYAYDVVFDGEIIISDSRDPEHDLARALLARGIKGNVTLHDAPLASPAEWSTSRRPRPGALAVTSKGTSGRRLRYPTAARTRAKTGIWYFRQCQTTIRLWHDQHPRLQFGRCSPTR